MKGEGSLHPFLSLGNHARPRELISTKAEKAGVYIGNLKSGKRGPVMSQE